jgi:hypothetical protein
MIARRLGGIIVSCFAQRGRIGAINRSALRTTVKK